MIIGLAKDAVQVVTYRPEWEVLYQEEAARLRSVLQGKVVHIEHIGSTAIIGMEAKPIIDINIAVSDLKTARSLVPDIEAVGYKFRPHKLPTGRLFFDKGPPECRTHHLSLAELTSDFYHHTMLFRNYLRAHPTAAAEYLALKRELAQKYADNRHAYTNNKAVFVKRILVAARTSKKPTTV